MPQISLLHPQFRSFPRNGVFPFPAAAQIEALQRISFLSNPSVSTTSFLPFYPKPSHDLSELLSSISAATRHSRRRSFVVSRPRANPDRAATSDRFARTRPCSPARQSRLICALREKSK